MQSEAFYVYKKKRGTPDLIFEESCHVNVISTTFICLFHVIYRAAVSQSLRNAGIDNIRNRQITFYDRRW